MTACQEQVTQTTELITAVCQHLCALPGQMTDWITNGCWGMTHVQVDVLDSGQLLVAGRHQVIW